jgi:hypothetical protein
MINNNWQVNAIISLDLEHWLRGYSIKLLEEWEQQLQENQKKVTIKNDIWKIITTWTRNDAMKIIEELYNK